MDPTHDTPMVSADPDPASLLEPETSAETEAADRVEPSAPHSSAAWSDAQRALFALAAIALFLLLIGLAARANSDAQPPYEPERPCWSFDDACCIEEYGWDECCRWPVRPDDDQGLFDAEERFADDAPPPLRCR